MRKMLMIVSCFLIVTACIEENKNEYLSSLENKNVELDVENSSEEKNNNQIELKMLNNEPLFSVANFVLIVNGSFDFNEIHRSLKMNIGEHTYKFVYGVPVVEQSGIYLAIDTVHLKIIDEEPYLSLRFLQSVLGLDVEMKDNKAIFPWVNETITASTTPIKIEPKKWTVEEMINYLSFLEKPIENATVSSIPNHLPGAKRPYRNGYHEGIDWYAYASGQHISTTTPVYAMADGIIVRVDQNYNEYKSTDIRNFDLKLTSELEETPEYLIDRLRGRQIWIQYENGVMNRFAHLNDIPKDLKVGDKVSKSTIVGFVGNSGTSGAVNKDGTQIHLHQDILIYGELFWKSFNLDEIIEIVHGVFAD